MDKQQSDASADNPPRRGRKKFQFIQRGKAALNAKIKKVLRPRSPTLPPDAPGPEAAGGLPLRGEDAHEALLAGEQYGVASERIEAHQAPVLLQVINYSAQGYKLVDIINTEDLPQWFHEQKNDYQPKEHSESQIVKLTWFGHPGDSPHDIRARKFVVRWASIASPEAKEMAVSKNRPVWRWLYVCAGVHDRVPPDSGLDFVASQATTPQPSNERSDAGDGSDAASEVIEDDENSGDSDDGAQRKRWNKCSSEVRLQFEITADNLAVVKIWQKGEHEDVDQSRLWLLMFSRFLRLQIMDRARRFGARATAIQRDLVGQFLLPSSSGGSVQLPEHRIPTQKQVRVMVSTSKHRTRLARNPFRATWLMVKRNSRDMYYYNPHDFEAPDHKSKFTVAITDNFSLDSTILNTAAPNGTLFMDSTHRLHNENRAATTVLCTANEGKHVMPGAYLISANIQASTIKDWFVETIRKIEARAQEVAADKSRIHHRDPAATDRLYARCQRIAANGKFDFTNINIDKSRSEYNGIVEALLELGITNYYIRLCQFHVIFAILRFDFDNGDQGLGFTIPVTMKAQILILFRALQRCRSMDQWEDAKRTFHAGLVDLLGETDQDTLTKAAAAERIATLHLEEEEEESSSSEDESPQPKARARSKRVPQPNTKKAKNAGKPVLQVVQEYFDQNWFVEPWIKLFTDIGMPPGQSRDDTWNTNNWAETAFKQFNAVFLDNKHNKRIDQLASIILNHHLPYFRFFPTPDRGPSKAFLQLNHDANKLWETEMVTPSAVPDTFMVRRVEKDGPVQHTVVLMPLSCTCSDYKYTGKACVDIVAARIYRKAGPNSNWKVVEAETEKPTKRRAAPKAKSKKTQTKGKSKSKSNSKWGKELGDRHVGKLPNDQTIDAELDNVFSKLRQHEENEKEDEVEPYFGEYRVSSGRPANAKPLRPWRRKLRNIAPGTYGYSPRFIKKRGPAKRVRIHRNSLLYFSDRRDLARRAARAERLRRLYVPRPSSSPSVPPPPPPPLSAPPPLSLPPIAPRDSDRFLNAEDASITTLQNTALWFHPRYKLRLDEMGVFVTLMNSCAIAVERGIIFLAGPPELGFRRHLHAIDWMQPLSVQQLRQANAHMLADLVESRHQQTVNRIVYFECRADHWTMFHHALRTDPPTLTWHNSLSIPEDNSLLLDIRDQRLLHQFFLPNRPKASPAALGPRYGVPTYHGLQKDDFTCGFWAVLIGFSALLDFDPCGIVIGAHYLKTLLRPLYSSFLRDETGVVASLLRDTFRVFKPRVDLQHLPATSVICPRPHQYERAAPASSLRDPATIWTLLLPEAHDVALDPHYSDLLTRIDAGDEHWHIVGDISIPPSRLKMLIEPEWTSEFVIDGYLELLIQDLSDDVTLDRSVGLPFLIPDTYFRSQLVDPKVKRNPRGIPPPARSNPRLGQRKRWFEDVNIFDLELMIAPIFWRNHWLLAVVFFKEKRIRIYDSWTTRSAQRGSAVYGRLYEVLLWEHKQLFGGESLPADWEGADTAMTTILVAVPRQVNTYDCGIYTLAFAQAMVQGVDPALMVFTPTSAARGRKVIANRLCRAIHDDARNAAALGIQVEEAPQTSQGSNTKSTRSLPARPVGHVVFFQNPKRSNQWLPAKTISLTEEHATMEWMCELLWLEENKRPCGQFVCLTEDWTQSARKIYEARDLAEIQWPASMLGHARYPSYASPSGRLLILALTAYKGMLVDQFLSRQPESTLFAQIKGDYVNRGPPRMTELSSGRAVEVSFELVLFPSFSLWRVPPHERLIFDLTNEIVEEVIDGVEGEDNRKALTHETEAIAAVSLCVAYVSRLTEQSEENVYAALKEGRVEWAKTDSEELRDIYGEACGGWLEVEQLKIAVPNLPPPIPIIIP